MPSDVQQPARHGDGRAGGVLSESAFARSRKATPTRELLCEAVYRPVAHLVVLALLPLRVPPPAVVLAAGATGLAAAVELARGHLLEAAALVVVKTVLDNADGQLARASARVTAVGRYLDSESDLVVNAALFAALGHATGLPVLAATAFVALTGLLSLNFTLRMLYRRERGEEVRPMPDARGVGGLLRRVYAVVYAPQERLVAGFVAWRLRRLDAGVGGRLAYHDRATIAVLHNLGLSTQMTVLAVTLLLGRPEAYLVFVLACAAAVPALALRRELRVAASADLPEGRCGRGDSAAREAEPRAEHA
jgi:phosphatidylglycerophosphate synthase